MTGPGSDSIATATPFLYGTASAPTPTAALTNESAEEDWGGNRSAWWMLTIPASHDSSVPVRFDLLLSEGVEQGDVTAMIEVYQPATDPAATGPTDLNSLSFMRRFWFPADGDLLLDPATFYVRCALQGSSPDTSYVLRIGDLAHGPSTTESHDPPEMWARTFNGSSVFIPTAQYDVIPWATESYGKIPLDQAQGLVPMGMGPQVSSQWYLFIVDTSNDRRYEPHRPLPDGKAKEIISATIGGAGPSGNGPQADENGDGTWPNGFTWYDTGGSTDGLYEASRKDWAASGAPIAPADSINITTRHGSARMGMFELCPLDASGLNPDPDTFLNRRWSDAQRGYPDYRFMEGAVRTIDRPGHVVSTRMIVATQVTGDYVEIGDQVVFGIHRYTTGEETDEAANRFGRYVSSTEGMFAHSIPWVTHPADLRPDEVTYSAYDVPEGFTFTENDQLMGYANAAITPGGAIFPGKGWEHLLGPNDSDSVTSIQDTWGWRIADGSKAWPDNSATHHKLNVAVWAMFEYRYKPPAWTWTLPGERLTVLAPDIPTLTPALAAELRDTGQRFQQPFGDRA